MEKKKKGIRCSYAVLLIILFATVCILTDYIVIERKTRVNNCPKCESTCSKCDVKGESSEVEESNEKDNDNSDQSAYVRTTNIRVKVADRNTYADISVVDGKLEEKYQSKFEMYEIAEEKIKYIHHDYYQYADENVIFVLTEKGNVYVSNFHVGESSEIDILNNFVKMDYLNVRELIKVYNNEYAVEDPDSGMSNMKIFYIYALTDNAMIKLDKQYAM